MNSATDIAVAKTFADAKRNQANAKRRSNRIVTGARLAECPTCGRTVTASRLTQHQALNH